VRNIIFINKLQKHALCPRVRNERRDTTQTNVASPYVAFRRRGEKMQTRKNRKNDEDGYERILKLSHDLRKASVLLEMLKRREKSKRELINLHAEIVDKRYSMADWLGLTYKECEREAKPSFQFANVEATRKGSAVKLTNNNNNQQYRDGRKRKTQRSERDEGLASRGWLQQNADDWHRTYGFPSSPPHRNSSPAVSQLSKQSAIASVLESVDALASTSTNIQLDGEFMFKRRRGCVYHAPKSLHSTNDNTSDATSHYTSLKDR
jgi:enhancer of polycomb-like protein